jgi:hypothetical protein
MFAGLWHWTAGVFSRIGDVSVYWLVLALALKTAESALIGLTWRNILDAAYPKAKVRSGVWNLPCPAHVVRQQLCTFVRRAAALRCRSRASSPPCLAVT